MTTFTVWKFDDPDGAGRAAKIVTEAASDGLVTIVDHVIVAWPTGAKRPTTRREGDDVVRSAGWGAFWGLLVGGLFLVPVVGAAAGAAVGALAKAMREVGITREQLDTLRWQITEGTSALFVITDDADLKALGERFKGLHSLLIDTNLTDVERGRLLDTFGTD